MAAKSFIVLATNLNWISRSYFCLTKKILIKIFVYRVLRVQAKNYLCVSVKSYLTLTNTLLRAVQNLLCYTAQCYKTKSTLQRCSKSAAGMSEIGFLPIPVLFFLMGWDFNKSHYLQSYHSPLINYHSCKKLLISFGIRECVSARCSKIISSC
jgi:hypothetical protein